MNIFRPQKTEKIMEKLKSEMMEKRKRKGEQNGKLFIFLRNTNC